MRTSVLTRCDQLAEVVYAHAMANYNDPKARWDTVVECLTHGEISAELERYRIFTKTAAIRHYRQFAKLQHEAYLNTEAHLHGEY